MYRIATGLGLIIIIIVYFILGYITREIHLKQSNSLFGVDPFPSSSIWCLNSDNEKLCTVNNICYIPNSNNEFFFLLTNMSTISGLGSKSEFKTFHLSSVNQHNRFHLKFTFISPETLPLQPVQWIEYPVFLVWRFKWDNIMHVIHDDVLPIFTTYNDVCSGNVVECVNKYTLAFVDGGMHGPYYHWYRIFSKFEPIFVSTLVRDKIICFRTSRIGLSKRSIWFQYGFRDVHGPIPSVLNSLTLFQFRRFVFDQFKINTNIHKDGIALLLSRKINRKIMNEDFVIKSIETVYAKKRLQLLSADLSNNDTNTILSLITNTKLLVGMHGSAMVFSIFLAPGSTIIELFPFGIQPQHVSSTKALCSLPSIQYTYLEWCNWNEINSIVHPEFPPLLGGIHHLPSEKQDEIKNVKLIPPVHCCHNPIYLYRMFQDTIVDNSFVALLEQGLNNPMSNNGNDIAFNAHHYLETSWYFPGPVKKIKCETTSKLFIISWDPPLNLEGRLADYKVSVAMTGQQDMSIVTYEQRLEISIAKLKQKIIKADIWILARVEQEESVDSYADCNVTR